MATSGRAIEVHKFGGTSVADAARMRGAAAIVADASRRAAIVVVSSAIAGATDDLVEALDLAEAGDGAGAERFALLLLERHRAILADLGGASGGPELELLGAELRQILISIALIGAPNPRARDRVLATGEKLAVRLLVAALAERRLPARARDADRFLETDGRHGAASPLIGVADRTIVAALGPDLDGGIVPVVTGFIGRGPDGATTTLGRGGSDFSATLLAAALGAVEVTIWTDVEGVFSASPRLVPEARVIPQLNFREAAELSYYGAKVLHQRTMIPVAREGIPVRTRSSFRPDLPGTVVDGHYTPGSHPVKAISAIGDHALLSVEGKGMAGVPGMAARVFGSLAAREISVTMISQSSSESSICLAVPAARTADAERALKGELRGELTRGDVDEIVIRRHVSLVAAVGLGMAHAPGVAARVFTSVAAPHVNVLAIAQGSSELNITLAVDERDVDTAIRSLHREFGLHLLDTGADTTHALDLLIVGAGKIGRALARMVGDGGGQLFQRFGLAPRVVAVADRSGYLLRPRGLEVEELRRLLQGKEAGRPIASMDGATAGADADAMVRAALGYRLARPVLVDVSDAEGAERAFETAFQHGCDVVTANKKPLAGSQAAFDQLYARASEHGRILRAEATVGAGLPIVDTLEMLLATGDRLESMEGCFSGTLGFLMGRLEAGDRFSDAVRAAVEAGFTEPDPVTDLSGIDVARKTVILGRLSGLLGGDGGVRLAGLVDGKLAGLPLEELLKRLQAYDEPMARRWAEAREQGQVLRYVATLGAVGIDVGLKAVAADSAIGMLRGTDNTVVFRSARYRDRPLVVTGPGAGVGVTAMGVMADILRIAAVRR